jgi:hypothetical protein
MAKGKFQRYVDKLENGNLKTFLHYVDEDELALLEFHFNKYTQFKNTFK